MRIMGLDLGTRNIGVAVSDETGTIAQGRDTIIREDDKSAIDRIMGVIDEFGVKEVVVGLPINMDGTLGERAEDSKLFARELERRTGLPVKLWDERLSTREAENIMLEADLTRKKRKKAVDRLAAQIILQGYLDSRRNEGD
jgi:putative Holliday junction resolvase